jgi:hypothetical protein
VLHLGHSCRADAHGLGDLRLRQTELRAHLREAVADVAALRASRAADRLAESSMPGSSRRRWPRAVSHR